MTAGRKIHISLDGQVFASNTVVGYIEDDTLYVFERGVSHKLGTFDHRNEAVKMVMEWLDRATMPD